MSKTTQGRRVDWTPGNDTYPFPGLGPGEYGKDKGGQWFCVPPGKDPCGWLGCLGDGESHHKVTEHEDGTVTVSPSILVGHSEAGLDEVWHGYLERGVWREC